MVLVHNRVQWLELNRSGESICNVCTTILHVRCLGWWLDYTEWNDVHFRWLMFSMTSDSWWCFWVKCVLRMCFFWNIIHVNHLQIKSNTRLVLRCETRTIFVIVANVYQTIRYRGIDAHCKMFFQLNWLHADFEWHLKFGIQATAVWVYRFEKKSVKNSPHMCPGLVLLLLYVIQRALNCYLCLKQIKRQNDIGGT